MGSPPHDGFGSDHGPGPGTGSADRAKWAAPPAGCSPHPRPGHTDRARRVDAIRDERYQHLDSALRRFAATNPGEASRAELRAQLVEGILTIACNIPYRFRQRGEPVEDLQQVASLGLLHALDRFRTELCRDFLAYAIPTITDELRRHFRDKG